MTNLSPTPPRNLSGPSPEAAPRGSLKSALAILVLVLLMLLFWQLFDQYRTTLAEQRQYTEDSAQDLATHLDLTIALSGQLALNQLPSLPPATPQNLEPLLDKVRGVVPATQALAWLDANGQVLSDTATADDHQAIQALWERGQRHPFYFGNSSDGQQVYLLLHAPNELAPGFWLLRMSSALFADLAQQNERGPHFAWLVKNRLSGAPIYSNSGLRPEAVDSNETVLTAWVEHSDWQLQALFDLQGARLNLLPALLVKYLLGLACSLLPLIALFNMRRRHRELRDGRRRYHDIFEDTGVALCVLDLAGLQHALQQNELNDPQRLDQWLAQNPDAQHALLRHLRITEANQVALRLLQVDSCEGAWQRLIDGRASATEGVGYAVIKALLARTPLLELELTLSGSSADDQRLWLTVHFPEHRHDLHQVILSITDVTTQIKASESLRDSEQRYRILAESISDVIFSADSHLALNYVSPSAQAVLGYDTQWIMDNGWQSIIANPQQLTGLYAMVEQLRRANEEPDSLATLREQVHTQLYLFDCLRADGRKIPIELRVVLVWDEQGGFEGVLGVGRDVSQQRRAEKDMRMAATVFEHSTSAILITDPAGYIVQANEAFSRVSGYAVAHVLDQLPNMLTVDEEQDAHLRYIVKQLNLRGTWEGEVWLKRRNGERYPAWVGITAVFDDEGDLASYVCFFSDISERKASEQRIHRLAYYDALTHLPNRTLFQDRLYSALQQAERQKSWVVLMFLDLDRFKPINDSLGHAAGDRMLMEMATRLLACVDDDDTVARMGGDEFTLLLQPRGSREQALNQAIHVAEQILASLHQPFVLENREFFVTASVGIALSPQDGNELSQLMKNADTAMYHAKERGKNNFQFYQADMNASALERLELESDLRHALEQNEFVLYYQPQFSGDGKRLTGAEALLRWRHPRRGLVPPGDFIPVLEELGLVVDVGDWVISEACRQLKHWHQARIRVPKVSVNISVRQFSDGQLGTRIATILKETGLPPACLELELTESILMREVNEAMAILDTLKNLGLSIAVDDFGTGYSSLNYLKQFPIDVLKIDRTFVDGLPSGEQDAQIARAIIAMAHSLNLAVIAEGVETHEQLEFLREHGCDEVQGYLFGRPMPASHFEAQFSNDSLLTLD
ncbi:EAL domain-containing protein [Pseudomonas sp. nanlin1]